jgi:NAD-dependent dihydropyrimidine dehydrogenase PreA subunit
MITYYGYTDGSGEFYISVDSDRCSGCGKCAEACPQKALILETQFIDLEDKTVAAVKEEHRKKIKYTCEPCKPETGQTPCMQACPSAAIKCTWKPQ